jgi:DNA-binding HxlR family transcriptional regulator
MPASRFYVRPAKAYPNGPAPGTYSEISAGEPGLSHSLLTQRLRQLMTAGIIRTRPKDRGNGQIYLFTDAGQDLWGVLSTLGTWGER